MAELCLMKHFRRNAEYAIDSLCFDPIDRNGRVRVIVQAEGLERRTKGKGCKSGVLRQSGLTVLRCLLFTFCAVPTGRCYTSSTHCGGLLLSHPQDGSLSSGRNLTRVVGRVTSHGSPCGFSVPGAPCCSCNSTAMGTYSLL